jgi:hypothetical protein
MTLLILIENARNFWIDAINNNMTIEYDLSFAQNVNEH